MPLKYTRADEATIRRLFNAHHLHHVTSGKYTCFVEADGHPSSPLAGEPYCTRSQMVSYRDDLGTPIAKCHRYLRPDGKIGLSGLPDPKQVRVGDEVFLLNSGLQSRPARGGG